MCSFLRLGDTTVQSIVEQEGPFFDLRPFFPDLTDAMVEENLPWLVPHYIEPGTNKVILRIQSYLVRTPHHTILVDSCVGNHKPRPARPHWDQMTSDRYERNLAASGVRAEDIDFVMCTHLHVDHVGWNTRLDNGRWVPTFPNARYIFSDKELGFWTERHSREADQVPWITDSVLPVVQAGRADIVRSDHVLDDHVHLIPTPGHTIDHYAVRVGRSGPRALIAGDMIHSPIQARYPELGIFADYDRRQGGETRRRIFEALCDTPDVLCSAHFPATSIGRISRWGDGFRFNPLSPA